MVKIASCSATKHLFEKIKDENLINFLTNIEMTRFSDGEISVKFPDTIRGCDLYLFGETSNNLTELLLSIDAAKRSSCSSITVILPYYGYSRQDKREHRGCLGASMMAHVLQAMGVDRVVSIDLHAEQIQGFFQVPLEHIRGHAIFLHLIEKIFLLENTILCSPDAGGVHRVEKYCQGLSLPMVMIYKKRDKPNSISSMLLIGDVKDKNVIIIDDMVDTCGTLKKAVIYLKEQGAKTVSYIATHAILSGKAKENLLSSSLDTLVISDTVELDNEFISELNEKMAVEVVSCVPVLEKVIINLITSQSIAQVQ